MSSRVKRNWEFFASILIIILTFFVMFAYYNRWFSFAARVGPYRIIHYIAFAGTFYIAFGVIFFSLIKRRSFFHPKTLLGVHTFGNLFSFLLVSMHFAGQVGRPADFYPEFGTGLALYISMVLLVSTGLSLRFGILKSKPKTKRFIHVSLAFTFYIIIFVHILHGIGII